MRHSKFHASDFPNYSVSEDGEIRNSKGNIIKGEISNNGYRRVSLSNNNVSNLEWCSTLDNLNHSHVIEKARVAKFRKVKCVTTGKIYNSIKEAADELGLYHSNIVACCNDRRTTCGGLEWEYL